jgi:hypothetical protein
MEMTETPETKAKLEAVLERARRLHPLRQQREMLSKELALVPHNLVPLHLKGKTLVGETERLQGEIAKIEQQERDLREHVREFFAGLAKASALQVQQKIAIALPSRRRLRALLVEAAAIYAELEQVAKDWKNEADALKKIAKELSQQTDAPGVPTIQSYTNAIPQPPFVSPWIPAPTVQQIHRARNQGDNIAEILRSMASQIG